MYVCEGEEEDFLFHFFLSVFLPPMFYSPSISALCPALSPAYRGDLIARGPGRIFREVSGEGRLVVQACGGLVANVDTHMHTHKTQKDIQSHRHRYLRSHTPIMSSLYTDCVNCFLLMLSF